jgi:hypothetical protein
MPKPGSIQISNAIEQTAGGLGAFNGWARKDALIEKNIAIQNDVIASTKGSRKIRNVVVSTDCII